MTNINIINHLFNSSDFIDYFFSFIQDEVTLKTTREVCKLWKKTCDSSANWSSLYQFIWQEPIPENELASCSPYQCFKTRFRLSGLASVGCALGKIHSIAENLLSLRNHRLDHPFTSIILADPFIQARINDYQNIQKRINTITYLIAHKNYNQSIVSGKELKLILDASSNKEKLKEAQHFFFDAIFYDYENDLTHQLNGLKECELRQAHYAIFSILCTPGQELDLFLLEKGCEEWSLYYSAMLGFKEIIASYSRINPDLLSANYCVLLKIASEYNQLDFIDFILNLPSVNCFLSDDTTDTKQAILHTISSSDESIFSS